MQLYPRRMTYKKCKKCGEIQSVSEFYLSKGNTDGLAGKCKSCTRIGVIKNRKRNVEHYRQYDRDRNKTDERKAHFIIKQRKRRAADPNYTKAHNAVARSIKSGKLKRPKKCQRCSAKENIQAHHDDYTKILKVKWLCPVCHAARHKQLGLLNTYDD